MIRFLRHEKSLGFLSSFALHAVIFLCGGLLFIRPVEYAVETGTGGIEVSLTAAPLQAVSVEAPVIEKPKEEVPPPAVPDPEDIVMPEQKIEEVPVVSPVQEPPKNIVTAANSDTKGDGSSSAPGRDATPFYSAGGAESASRPDYLRNPAPAYPWDARQNGWFGTVILSVRVSPSGEPLEVSLEKGSGYTSLDDSALKTVRKWRFHPARMGGIAVETHVRVPVRFTLENTR